MSRNDSHDLGHARTTPTSRIRSRGRRRGQRPNMVEVRVSVQWTDRVGDAQTILFGFDRCAIDPAFTGAFCCPATWHDAAAGSAHQRFRPMPKTSATNQRISLRRVAARPKGLTNPDRAGHQSCSVSTGISTSAITTGDLTSCATDQRVFRRHPFLDDGAAERQGAGGNCGTPAHAKNGDQFGASCRACLFDCVLCDFA